MKLKQCIFNYVCARHPRSEVTYPNYNRIGSVFILYESDGKEQNPAIRAIVQQLHKEGKHVVSLGYCKKDKIQSPMSPDSRILGSKDFNWLDKPKSDVVQFMEKNSFDILIDLTITPVLPMQYIAMLSRAKFKIGTYDATWYNMVVQRPQQVGTDYIFQQIMHYLKLIKSAD